MGLFIFFKKRHPDMQTLFHTLPRFFPALFSAFILLSVFVLPAHAQSGAFTITPATGWSYATNILTITANGTYTITMATAGSTTTADRVVVNSGVTANITLNGVSIDRSADGSYTNTASAFNMTGATVNLTLQGSNTLKSGAMCAGLQAPSGTTLAIDGSGSLSAMGGLSGAGIGGGNLGNGGIITIHGSMVTATGGDQGAGIGGGQRGNGGTITIHGGTVTATGGLTGAGIGGGWGDGSGNGSGGTITIHDGMVTTTGGYFGSGIGGGRDGAGGTITIDGGTILATGGFGGAGIGSGYSPSGAASGTITITGDANVSAASGNLPTPTTGGGAGIGSGGSWSGFGAVNTIIISTTGTFSATGGTGISGRNGAAIGQGGRGIGDGPGIPYHPVWFSIIDAGTASGSTISAAYGGSSIVYGLCVPDGATVTITATGAGAASYTYNWSGTASGTDATYTPTVDAWVKAIVTVTGTGLRSVTSVPVTSGGILIALGVLLAGLGAGALRRKFA
jgi:hypothetical protein